MEATDAAAGFAALAQETRLEILSLLSARPTSGTSAGALAAALAQPPSTLSFHLAAPEQAGLVRSERQGRRVLYGVRRDGLRPLLAVLAEIGSGGRPDLRAALLRLLPDDDRNETVMSPAYNVLFICTRNSARSIMAEAILERIGHGRFKAYSAGSVPADGPMPEVIERLVVLGHDVASLRSKSWHDFTGPSAPRMDFVITLCDPADSAARPDLGDRPLTANWPFPDPAKFTGSATERTALLNELYGMIRRRLEAFASLPFDTLDRMALKARLDALGDSAQLVR